MAQYDKLINLGLLNQFLTKAKTIFAPKITASGILKGDGNGGVSAATAGTDYATPAQSLALGLTDASVGDLVRVNAVDSNGKPTSWRKAPLCEIKTNLNLLDNWDFANPVNQRGQTSYSNAGYTIDRWKLTSGSVEVVSGGITLNGAIVQILETSIGQIVTASALLTDGTIITPTYNDTTKTFTLTATGQTIKAVKLELGSEQTLAHNGGTESNPVWILNEIPDYGEELRKCQMYLYRYNCPTPHFTSTDTYMMIPIVHDFASKPRSIVESANISWYRIDGVQKSITNNTLEIADATAKSLNIKLTPTPAPGSSNKNKLGYITRLNVLVSAEP